MSQSSPLLKTTSLETGSACAAVYLGKSSAEAVEHLPHVASFLHADDTQVILLIHPNQEGLVVVVPAGKSVGFITEGTGSHLLSTKKPFCVCFNKHANVWEQIQ